MDADVAFRQHRHAGNAAAILELVQMDVQQGCARLIHRVDQRRFDPLAVVQALGFPKVDDQMAARIGQAVLGDEVILLVRHSRGNERPERASQKRGREASLLL